MDLDEEASWELDTAIPLGLMLSEVITNSLTHGFPQEKDGLIRIELRSGSGGAFEMEVADDGVGVPSHVDFSNPTSLGLKLVRLLAEQSGATVELNRELGTRFRVVFPAVQ